MLFYSVVRFRRTGESTRSEEDGDSRQQQDVRAVELGDQESEALTDGAEVPREFANPTDGTVQNAGLCYDRPTQQVSSGRPSFSHP